MTVPDEIAAIGIVTVSDRASAGSYRDTSGPAIEEFLRMVLTTPWRAVRRLVPDGIENVRDALIDLADREKCALVFTTGGTGPALRDLTPEATVAACTKLMPGFGELMRLESLKQVPTAILSRQTAGIGDQRSSLIYPDVRIQFGSLCRLCFLQSRIVWT